MNNTIIDLSGHTFGRLNVLRYVGKSKHKAALWECECECGTKKIVNSNALRTGHTQSCWCMRKDSTSSWITRYSTKHGGAGSRLYVVWNGIKARTTNPKNSRYQHYGARGIVLCEEWQDFDAFRRWALENGYDEDAPYGKCTIDRIDVNGNYEPSNCRWVDLHTQAKNKRRKRHGTEVHTIQQD